jgi:hypothetical protein
MNNDIYLYNYFCCYQCIHIKILKSKYFHNQYQLSLIWVLVFQAIRKWAWSYHIILFLKLFLKLLLNYDHEIINKTFVFMLVK